MRFRVTKRIPSVTSGVVWSARPFAMQKVVGSSPIIRSSKKTLQIGRFCCPIRKRTMTRGKVRGPESRTGALRLGGIARLRRLLSDYWQFDVRQPVAVMKDPLGGNNQVAR
jgi:hypothetical protein